MRFGSLLFCTLLLGCPDEEPARPSPGSPCEADSVLCHDGTSRSVCIGGITSVEDCDLNERCVDGVCQSSLCAPDALRCRAGGLRERCAADGSAWMEAPCPQGTACDSSGQCVSEVCEPGGYRCAEDEDGSWDRQRCDDDGMIWVWSPCRQGERCRGEGRCEPTICRPESTGCIDDRTIGRCNEEGSNWVPEATCESGTICDNGRCKDACDMARQRSSYDGCTFFAVDLPQIGEAERRQDQHPFAVVLANTQSYGVRVTIDYADGSIAQAAGPTVVPGGDVSVASQVETADGEVRDASGSVEGVEIPPQGIGTFILPSRSAGTVVQGNRVDYVSEIAARAYRVQTDGPVTAYQFQPLCCNYSFTNDATLLIPAGSQGLDYLAVSATHQSRPGFLTVVASEQATTLDIDLGNRRVALPPGLQLQGGMLRTELEPYEVLTLVTSGGTGLQADLTGVRVAASTEVSVFGGHVCTDIPHDSNACDHLETVVMPVSTWRAEYVAAHTLLRSRQPTEVNYYRIQVAEAGTRISIDPAMDQLSPLPPMARGLPNCTEAVEAGGQLVLGAGQWCEFGTQSDFVLRANNRIQLTQFISGQESTRPNPVGGCRSNDDCDGGRCFLGQCIGRSGGDHAGDPAMTIVPPTDQFRTEYIFLTPSTYWAQYVNIIHVPGAEILLDGIGMNLGEMFSEEQLPWLAEADESIGDGHWMRSVIKLGPGRHQIEALDGQPFGIMVYAYDDYVSYAYPGGMDLAKQ